MPDELASDLSPQDHALVWLLVAGNRWKDCLDELGVPPRAKLRDAGIPDRIRAAAEWAVERIAQACGLDRAWILAQWMSLYRRAASGEPVYDRGGRPTGEWKFDGPTAVKALSALENHAGIAPKRAPGAPMDLGDVAVLLRAVASAGKPTLEQRQARLIGSGSTANSGSAPLDEKA